MKEIADLSNCPLIDVCKNTKCFIYQIIKENRSPWLFKEANIERTNEELLKSETIRPQLEFISHPTMGLKIYCKDYI